MKSVDFQMNLQQMRENLITGENFKLSPPLFMDNEASNEPLDAIYGEYERLLAGARICYAHVVQANMALYSSYPNRNYPAVILFSEDERFKNRPYELSEAAHFLYSYKNRYDAPPDIRYITAAITDEYATLVNEKLPKRLTGGAVVYYTTIMVFRKCLPKRRLLCPIFPVVVDPEHFKSTLILPKRYWTKEFIAYYKGKYKGK